MSTSKTLENSQTDLVAPVTTRGRWDRIIELLMDNTGKDLEARGWDLTKHIKLATPSDVTDGYREGTLDYAP